MAMNRSVTDGSEPNKRIYQKCSARRFFQRKEITNWNQLTSFENGDKKP